MCSLPEDISDIVEKNAACGFLEGILTTIGASDILSHKRTLNADWSHDVGAFKNIYIQYK